MSSEHYAYGEEWAHVEAVMRLHAVKRWHMIDTTRTQTLAEHTANVALLTYVVALKAPGMFFGPAYTAAAIALLHDLGEVFVGDIPTHTKRHLSGVDELERATLPRDLRPAAQIAPEIKNLIKFCDLADGIRFIRLHGVDVTSDHAKDGLENQYDLLRQRAFEDWPEEVAKHVITTTTFYAYERS